MNQNHRQFGGLQFGGRQFAGSLLRCPAPAASGVSGVWLARGAPSQDLVDNVLTKTTGDANHLFEMDLADVLRRLGPSVTVTAVGAVASSPAGLSVLGAVVGVGAKSVQVQVSGGTDGVDYDVTVPTTLSTGQVVERTGPLRVRKK